MSTPGILNGPAVGPSSVTVTSTSQELKVGASVLDGRQVVMVQPLDGDIYFGFSSSVSSTAGFKIFRGQIITWEATELLPIWLVAASGDSVTTIIAEVG